MPVVDLKSLALASAGAAFVLLASTASVSVTSSTSETIPLSIRGKSIPVVYYRAATATPKGTIFMGSGDVGWVGLGADLAEELSRGGYAVVGLNVREYLSSYSAKSDHAHPEDVAADFKGMADALRTRRQLPSPVIVSGVSEGAAMAVLAAADPGNHAWIAGVMTLGLPPTAELAWHWRDATTWITKKDADEPSFAPKDFIARVAPLPLLMIQSTKDEYVTEADYRAIDGAAQAPKKLVLIAASNHRFTDKRADFNPGH